MMISEIYSIYPVSETTNYNQLPLGENSDEDWADDVNDPTSQDAHNSFQKRDTSEVVIRDTDALINQNRRPFKGTAYEFSRSRNRKYDEAFCTAPRAAVCFAAAVLLFGSGYLFGFLTPSGDSQDSWSDSGTQGGVALKKRSENWRTKMLDWGKRTSFLFGRGCRPEVSVLDITL